MYGEEKFDNQLELHGGRNHSIDCYRNQWVGSGKNHM